LVDADALRKIKEEVNEEISEAYLFAKASPYPKAEELNKYLFKES
jgi:TPP-dependent pyruvate/acetoin dehydrogenase alpha subunit